MTENHPDIAPEVWNLKDFVRGVLVERARLQEPMTYTEIAQIVSRAGAPVHARSPDLHNLLGVLSEDEDEKGRGMLSVLVVKKEEGNEFPMPGEGFFKLARSLGRKGEDITIWSAETKKVLEVWSKTEALL